jgi:hypothetical protein
VSKGADELERSLPSFANGAREEIAPSLSLSKISPTLHTRFLFQSKPSLFLPGKMSFLHTSYRRAKRLGPPAGRETVSVRRKTLSGRRALLLSFTQLAIIISHYLVLHTTHLLTFFEAIQRITLYWVQRRVSSKIVICHARYLARTFCPQLVTFSPSLFIWYRA